MRKVSGKLPLRGIITAITTFALLGSGVSVNAYQTDNLLVYLDAGNTASYNSAVSTSVWNDLSTTGYVGTIRNTLTQSGGALNFAGGYSSSNSLAPHVDLGSGLANFGTGITIETEGNFGAVQGIWERIFDFGNGAENDNIWLGRYSNSDEIAIEIWTGSTVGQPGNTPNGRCKTADTVNAIPANASSKKFTVTLDGSVCRIYIDGAEVETEVDYVFGSGYFDNFTNNPNMMGSRYEVLPRNVTRTNNYIGRSNWGSDDAFEGSVKYLRIYTQALTAQAVQNNATTTTPSSTLTYATTGADSGSAPAAYVGDGAITLASNTGGLAKSGHQFVGWATTAHQTTAISNSYTLSSSVTLYPAFAPVIAGTPGTPTATISNTTATVNWTAPTTGVTPFTYAVASSPAGANCTVAGTSASCSGLTGGTSYTFSVTATNTVGTSSPSSASNSVLAVAVVVIPGTPGTPTATISNTTASVSWSAPGTGTAPFTYAVTSSPAGATCTISALTASCTGLTDGTNYTFAVTATNTAGTSGSSASSNSVLASSVPAPQNNSTPPSPALQVITPVGSGTNAAPRPLNVKPGQTQTLTGTGLESVNTVRIGNIETSINQKSGSQIQLQIPRSLPAGKYKIELIGAFGTISQEDFLEVPRRYIAQVAAGFSMDSAKLNSALLKKITNTIASLDGATRVVCIGSTSGTIVTAEAKKVAKARAIATCSKIKALNPNLDTSTRINPASGVGPQARKTKILVYNY